MRGDWKKANLGQLAEVVMGQSPDSTSVAEAEFGFPFLQGNADFGAKHPHPRLFCSRPAKVCRKGDVLLSVRAPVGAVNLADREYCIGRGLSALRFAAEDQPYGWHVVRYSSPNLRRKAQGTTFEAVSRNDILTLHVLTADEQSERQQVAQILDALDAAIDSTEAVIAKLKLMKAGLLHDLLTRGIDDDGELRDLHRHPEHFCDTSLGVVPSAWAVCRLADKRHPARPYIKTGPFGSTLKGEHWTDEGVPVITIGSLGEGRFVPAQLLHVSERKAATLAAYRVERGDLVFSRVADVGRSAVISQSEDGWIMSSNLMRLSLDTAAVVPQFAYYNIAFNEGTRRQVRRTINAGGREVANTKVLNALEFPWPPPDEQARIVAVVSSAERRIRSEEERASKLYALKHGLMHDLLTGRVRVPVQDHSLVSASTATANPG